MKISRKVKVSDDNYGNTTQKLEFEVQAQDMSAVNTLLDKWEALVRQGVCTRVMSANMTVREVREYEQRNGLMQDIFGALSRYEVS